MLPSRQSAILRIHRIDAMLRGGRKPTPLELAQELEVSTRTVARDIEFMRILGAPLGHDKKAGGYFYTEPYVGLPAVTLTRQELESLEIARRVLRQFEGTPYGKKLGAALRKIIQAVPAADAEDLGRGISFSRGSARPSDPEVFDALRSAMAKGGRLRIRYHTLSRDTYTERVIDPFHLANVSGDWYLIALCHLRNEIRMFMPHRILSIKETGETFEPPKDFDVHAFLAPAFSVMRGGRTWKVKVRFAPEAAKYVREKIWHHTQKVTELDHGGLELALEVQSALEVKRWILSWGAHAEVLKPKSLRKQMVEEGKGILKAHGKPIEKNFRKKRE